MFNSPFLSPSELIREHPPLAPEIKDFLQKQTISLDSPGRIFRDWQTLLDFLGSEGVEVSEKTAHFSMKLLPEINARLSRPIEIALKRPLQKSYPYIHGLYLLLRTLGLAYPIREGKKTKLILDQDLLKNWENLNPTEQYLILLEVWMFEASEDKLDGYYSTPNFLLSANCWADIPPKGLKITKQNAGRFNLDYNLTLTHLALLELFGIINLEQGKPLVGQGWRLISIEKTQFGEAMMQVLFRCFLDNAKVFQSDNDNPIIYGKCQPYLQEFFPDYQHHFVVNEDNQSTEITEGIYQFKVSLDKVWRRIIIPSHLKLESLVDVILGAFNFDKDHLYRFICKNRRGRILHINHPYLEEEPPFTNQFRVGQLPLQPGEIMVFHFDFGDDWEFSLLLEAINPPDKKIKRPLVKESHGEAPPQYWDEEE